MKSKLKRIDPQLLSFLTSLNEDERAQFLRDMAVRLEREKAAGDLAQYTTPDGIVRFVREILKADPAPYQEKVLRALVEHQRVAVRGPHGLGKTTLAAWVALWALYTTPDNVKVATTASAWRQLTKYLWPEIRRWARPLKWQGVRVLDLAIKFASAAKEAFAIASDNPALIEGVHADTVVYILDESKAIPPAFWDAIEGAFSSGDCYALAISTPGESTGRLYDIFARRPGLQDWYPIHVTLDEAVAAGRIRSEWAEQRRQQWGEGSAVYQNRVLGNFADSGENSVIPLSWVEAANRRWEALNGRGIGGLSYGVDPARFGRDRTSIARLVGRVLESLTLHAGEDTMQTAGRVGALISPDTPVAVDAIGLGAGVADRLKELGYKVKAVNVAEAARGPDGKPLKDATDTFEFFNLRSYLWWLLREALDPTGAEPLALPDDDNLTGDLTAPTFSYTSAGKIKVESKDDIRARLGRSTDSADALGLALFAPIAHAPVVTSENFGFMRTRVIWPGRILPRGPRT